MAGSGGSYHSLNSLFGLNIKLVLFLFALQNLKYIHAILLMTYRHYFLVIKLLSEKARMVSDCHFPQVPAESQKFKDVDSLTCVLSINWL